MSLARLVYYSAVIGGWGAFVGWAIGELFVFAEGGGTLQVMVITALVGGAIGAGLNVVAGITNLQWKRVSQRVGFGALLGGLGGALGGVIGNLMFEINVPRAFGFMVLGICVGVTDGLFDRSTSKIRNGLIGGAVGGFIGGILLEPLVAAQAGMSGRATAFVVLGLCVGLLIGFVQVALRRAWLTVLDGFGPGRQLILGQEVTILGRGDYLPLPFLGPTNQDLSPEHSKITRRSDGSFTIECLDQTQGTTVNRQPVKGVQVLRDGDVIKLGKNSVLFNEKQKQSAGEAADDLTARESVPAPPPPPPPPPGVPRAVKQSAAPQTAPARTPSPSTNVPATSASPPVPPKVPRTAPKSATADPSPSEPRTDPSPGQPQRAAPPPPPPPPPPRKQ